MGVAEFLLMVYAVLGNALLSADPSHWFECYRSLSFPCPLLCVKNEQDLRISYMRCIVILYAHTLLFVNEAAAGNVLYCRQ